jgi:hypothetical protein
MGAQDLNTALIVLKSEQQVCLQAGFDLERSFASSAVDLDPLLGKEGESRPVHKHLVSSLELRRSTGSVATFVNPDRKPVRRCRRLRRKSEGTRKRLLSLRWLGHLRSARHEPDRECRQQTRP